MLVSAFVTRCRLSSATRTSCVASFLRTANSSSPAVQAVLCAFSCSFVRSLKTFIPFAGSTPEEGVLRSLLCLDDKRLGKQRVESQRTQQRRATRRTVRPSCICSPLSACAALWLRVQLIRYGRWPAGCRSTPRSGRLTISRSSRPHGPSTRQSTCGWGQQHTTHSQRAGLAVKVPSIVSDAACAECCLVCLASASYADALALYLLMNVELWAQRCSPGTGLAYSNGLMLDNIARWRIRYKADRPDTLVSYTNTAFPPWWGDARVHDSDKAILYRKDHSAYAHFKRYALQYEQYVWPYQIEEEARRRQRLAAGLAADEDESEGDEEAEGFVPDELNDDKDKDGTGQQQQTDKRGAAKAKEAKKGRATASTATAAAAAPRKATRKRRLDTELVELDEDDEQVDAAVVSAMHAEPSSTNGQADGGEHGSHKEKRQQRKAHKKKHRKAAMEPTEEKEEAPVAAEERDDDNVVHPHPPAARGRGRKAVKQAVKMEDSSVANEVSGGSEQQQQQREKPRKRTKQKQELPVQMQEGDERFAERRRSGRRKSDAAVREALLRQ